MQIHYKNFYMSNEVDTWVSKYSEYFPQTSVTEKSFLDSLYLYSGFANLPLNSFLRFGEPDIGIDDYLYPCLQSLLLHIPQYTIPDNILVYRYINKNMLKQMCPSWPPKKGMTILDKSFLSTTLLRNGVQDYRRGRNLNVVLTISIPSGTKGVYIGLTDTLPEYEVILPPNTKLRIDSMCFPFPLYNCTVIDS